MAQTTPLSIVNPNVDSGLYMLTEDDIIALEALQRKLALESYQTARRISTWNRIESIINDRYVEPQSCNDKRNKMFGYTNYIRLGAEYRIDHVRASFIHTLYLDLNDHTVFAIDHCCMYSVK